MNCKSCHSEIDKRNKSGLCHPCYCKTKLGSGRKNYCLDCGIKIYLYSIRCRHCWSKLYGKNQIGKRNPYWRGGKPKCKICGSSCNRWSVSYCSKKCFGISEQNEKHHNWRDGSSRLKYPEDFGKALKRFIRQRDKNKCQLCGVPEIECKRKLAVHHIDYDKYNCNPNNLISLCASCHAKTVVHKDYWIKYFNNVKVEVHH